MAYCLFRLYTEQQRDEHRFERARSEMLPKIQQIAGFQRFAGFRTNDGRYGGLQVYETRDGVHQAATMFNEWRQRTGNHDPVALELRGEVGLSIVVNSSFEKGYGAVRIYRTDSSFEQVNAAIEHEAADTIRNLPGLLRYTTVKFDDGRIGTFTACETEQAARDMTDKARELRSKPGSQLSKVLAHDPDVIVGEITLAVTKAAAKELT